MQAEQSVPLRMELFHTVVVAHQECATTLLAFLMDFADNAASFRRIISQVFVDCSPRGVHNSALDLLFTSDSTLWIGKWRCVCVRCVLCGCGVSCLGVVCGHGLYTVCVMDMLHHANRSAIHSWARV